MRTATSLLADLGLKTKIVGSGTIYAQFPKQGEQMRVGSTVILRGKAKSLELIAKTDR